ncbi:hypothetical protein HJC23_003632 [Cyclotella cryptica]|uniref:SCP domain-containing protein n=1 Tax=Cyclotella cryptica TaxID=29204 RepID=A0ABD3QLI6_9STRA|eukprot:CCRYP_004914-RA/>CCRYP_004914-RA protein AED:0.30 eAED:0.30 QI:0/-1/0/1/-1/1/1/0/749
MRQSSKQDNSSKTENNWMDFTSDLFSVNTTDWGTIQDSMCGAASAVQDNYRDGVVVDAENQYAQLYNSIQVHNSMHNPEDDNREMASIQNSQEKSNSYLPSAYAAECDESDYGEILVHHDALDAVSTVTPATFAQRETMVDFSQTNEQNMAVVADDTSHEVIKVRSKNTRRRNLIFGGILLVAVILLVIVVVVPVVVSKARAGESAPVSSAEKEVTGNDQKNHSANGNDDYSPEDNELSGYYGMNATIGESTTHHEENYEMGQTGNYDNNPGVESDMEDPDHYASEPAFQEDSDSNLPASTTFGKDDAYEGETPGMSPYVTSSTSAPTADSPNLFVSETEGETQPDVGSLSANSNAHESTPAPSSTPTEALLLSSMSTPVNSGGRPTSTSSSNTFAPTYVNTMLLPYSDDSEELGSVTSTPTYLFSHPNHSEEEVHTVAPTPSPHPPTLQPTKFTESVVKIKLQTDRQGYETSWSLESINFNTARNTNTSTVIARVDENTYSSYQKDSKTFTLPQGTYRFTLRDAFGDGFCCKEFQGHYSISIDGREVIKGGYYRSEISYDFLIGYFPEMTERETQWLEAHNVRRKMWHENNGVSYVPLRWSSQLAKQAETWANKLTADCEIIGIEHEHGVEEGENLAKNQADGKKGMGQLFPPDNILRRWVDQEADLPNPHNLHLTQALWRATKYVGCGDALREDDDGSVCRIQVCRYAKAGNCQMGKYNVTEGDNWLIPMLMDDSPCPPECPPEGCF